MSIFETQWRLFTKIRLSSVAGWFQSWFRYLLGFQPAATTKPAPQCLNIDSTRTTGSPFPYPLLSSLAQSPSKSVAFSSGTTILTRHDLLRTVARCAAALAEAGLSPGDSIALDTAVTPAAYAVQLAAYTRGLRVVAVKPGTPKGQLEAIMAGAQVLVVDQATKEDVNLRDGLRVLEVEKLVKFEPEDRAGNDMDERSAPLVPECLGNPDSIALVTYTSGSTGAPKGVAYTYARLRSAWQFNREIWTDRTNRLAERYSRFLLFGTLASAVMLEHLAFTLTAGGTAIIPSEGMDVLGREFEKVLAREKISAVLLTVPRLYHVLDVLEAQSNDQKEGETASPGLDLSHLLSAIIAGSPLPPHRLEAAIAAIGDAAHQAYGTNETGKLALLTADDVKAHPEAATSVGRAWAGVELQIRDAHGKVLPKPGVVGEIWARVPGRFEKYIFTEDTDGVTSNGDQTDSTDGVLDSEGWVATRDMGTIDANGFLYLGGRQRDVVIVNAVVHYAAAIEGEIEKYAGVSEAYVVGIPDEKTGEAVAAFVVAKKGMRQELDVEGLRAHVNGTLGPLAIPTTVKEIMSVPLLPSGKPDKQALLKRLSGVEENVERR